MAVQCRELHGGRSVALALQLHFGFEVSASGGGLVSAPPT